MKIMAISWRVAVMAENESENKVIGIIMYWRLEMRIGGVAGG